MAGTMVTRTYGNFRGVDFANRTPDLTRSPDAVNLWKNYLNEGKSVETRPKLATKIMSNKAVYNVFRFYTPSHTGQKEYIIYIIKLPNSIQAYLTYQYLDANEDLQWDTFFVYGEITDLDITPNISGFQHDEIFYITAGYKYIAIAPKSDSNQLNRTTISSTSYAGTDFTKAYIPTTSSGRKPDGSGGTQLQAVNLLSNERKNTFVADGTSTLYYLDVESADSVAEVKVNGEVLTSGYSLINTGGAHVGFTGGAPSAPTTPGEANVEIIYTKQVTSNRKKIDECTLCLPFDDRVFFSGNPKYPNVIFYSALDDPTYVPDTNWTKAGTDVSPVKSLVVGNDSLWAFKETNTNETTIFYYVPATNPDTGATYYYPQNSTIQKGCVSIAKNFNDDIVAFTKDGLEGITGDLQSQQVLGMRSSMVNSKMLAELRYNQVRCATWRGYLVVGIGQHIYLADSRQKFANEAGTAEYEWFYWDMSSEFVTGEHILNVVNVNDVLYIATNKGVATLTDTTSNVTAYWVTPSDDLGYPSYRKVSNKRGCTMRLKGEKVEIQAKMDAGEFSSIATYTNSKGYVVPRIKLKKWKEVQFKFTSDKRFGVYDMTMEFYVGGYVKR